MDTVLTGLVAGLIASLATLVTQFLTQRHQKGLLFRELEHQTRAALRETYQRLLAAQRRSRMASLELSKAGADSGEREELGKAAIAAYAAFIERYYALNLDANSDMWHDARSLRRALEHMLRTAREPGSAEEVDEQNKNARRARQNLERSFRIRLEHAPLRDRQPNPYEKEDEGGNEKALV